MDYEIKLPEGQKFKISGPEGFTQEQAWSALQQQLSQAPGQDPELLGFDTHPEEGGAAGGIYKRAAGQLLPSAGRDISETASGLWNIVSNPKAAWGALKEQAQSEEGIGGAIWNDISRHYGSIDRAQKTFETDPARFLMDLVTLPAGGAALVRKIGMLAAKTGRHVIPEVAAAAARETGGAVTPPTAAAFRTAGDVGEAGGQAVRGFRAGIRSPTTPAGATTTAGRAAGEALGAAGWRPRHLTAPSVLGAATGALTGGVIPGSIAGAAGMATSSPRLMGETMLNLGRLQRGAQALPRMRTGGLAAGAELTRAQIQQQAQAAIKDPEFKKGKSQDQLKPVRKVARDPNADSRTMMLARQILAGRTPQMRIETGFADLPEYGGPEGGIPSRQEGGPVTAGRAYSVGDAPGATPDTPKPEMFIPDRGPSPAQAAGGAATEAVGWISDAWASILKGEKPPPLPSLPETGKVPSTADPRPIQALGEQTSFLSQLAGPPGAAAAKGLGAAALGAAAGKGLLKGAAEEGAEMAGKGIPENLQSMYALGKKVGDARKSWSRSESHTGNFLTDWAYGHLPNLSEREFTIANGFNDPVAHGFYEAGRQGHELPQWVRGARFGDIPKEGVSWNYRENTPEHGVSMVSVEHPDFSNYQWADMGLGPGQRISQRPLSKYEGWLLPFRGGDDEPLMVGLRPEAQQAAPAAEGIRAYHGSPYDFPKFSSEKIGTGEGAQAYGHGLYFAENEEVATQYRKALAEQGLTPSESLAANVLETKGYGRDKGIKYLQSQLDREKLGMAPLSAQQRQEFTEAIDLLKSNWETPLGKTYEVNIKAEREHFLDWDKPLSEQSEHVRKILDEIWGLPSEATQKTMTGSDAYRILEQTQGSDFLRKGGIPGIKYLDQGSRAEGGTSNFVVFNDALIDIVRKYGIAAIAAIPPALALKNEAARNRQ